MDLCSISMKPFRELKYLSHNSQKLLFVSCVMSLALPNVLLFFTEQMSAVASFCNVILPVSVMWFAMTLSNKPGKAYLCLFPFVFFAAFQIVLLSLFSNSVIAVDMFLNLTTTNTSEAIELLYNIRPAVVTVLVIYIPLLAWSVYSIYQAPLNESFLLTNRRYATCGCVIGAILLVASYASDEDYHISDDLYPVNVIYNAGTAIERTVKTQNYFNTSQNFTFNAKPTHDELVQELHVLVIGETARAENFGLYGYERNTTPLLDSIPGLIIFRDVLSQSNTTHKSVPMLLSAISAENFNDIYSHKSIITAFNEVGYATAFFSNQRHNHSFIDFFGKEAQECKYVKQDKNYHSNNYDSVLASLLENYLKSGTANKRFVILHTYGSHYDYSERYPDNKAYYKPDKVTSATYEQRDRLINAYDNTIRATDEFLSTVIRLVEKEGIASTVTYVSDHGEDLYDDNRKLFLHSSPLPSIHQLKVPLIMWTSPEYNQLYPEKTHALQFNVSLPISSNKVVFHTLLDLAGIESDYLLKDNSLSSTTYTPEEYRLYLNDHNEAVAISSIIKQHQ